MVKKNEQLIDTMLPETAALERAVLSDAVNAPHALGDIIPIVHEDFFTSEKRKDIWRTLVKYYNEGRSIDYFSVTNAIGIDLFQSEILNQANNSTGSGAFCMEDAAALRNAASQRRAYIAASAFIRRAVAPGVTEMDILASAEQLTREIEGPSPLMEDETLGHAIMRVADEIEQKEKLAREGKMVNIPTGFEPLDGATYGGFSAPKIVILAARPSVGKTAIMLHMAKAAARAGNPVAMFSLEMTNTELASRYLYSTGRVIPRDVANGCVDWDAFNEAQGELDDLPICLDDFSRSLDDIVARMTQMVKRGKCKIAFIDYLGLFRDCYDDGNRKLYQTIGKITGTLKAVAKRLGIPIVLLCQLNRDQAKDGREPELYDLRDSGSIEQDADIVLMLQSHQKGDPIKVEGEPIVKDYLTIQVFVRKNRHGRKDWSFLLRPNDTYSDFTVEQGIIGELPGDRLLPEDYDKNDSQPY